MSKDFFASDVVNLSVPVSIRGDSYRLKDKPRAGMTKGKQSKNVLADGPEVSQRLIRGGKFTSAIQEQKGVSFQPALTCILSPTPDHRSATRVVCLYLFVRSNGRALMARPSNKKVSRWGFRNSNFQARGF